MHIIPLVLDCRPFFLPAGTRETLLSLPLGGATVLEYLVRQLAGTAQGRILVLTDGPDESVLASRVEAAQRAGLRIVGPEALAKFLPSCEASDYLLVVEPRFWPAAGYAFEAFLEEVGEHRGATNAIAVGSRLDGARERIECDASGRIRRVQRIYDPRSWPGTTAEGGTFCSLVPARAVCDLTFESLAALREQLALRGVLMRDVAVLSDLSDLANQGEFLAVSGQLAAQAACRGRGRGVGPRTPGVLVGSGCRVDPSARLVPPVVLQNDVTVESDAALVGPVVVGAGARIGRNAVLAESVLGWGSQVPAAARVCREILVADAAAGNGGRVRAHGAWAGSVGVLEAAFASEPLAWGKLGQGRRRRVRLAGKRLLDAALAATGLLVLSPLLLAVAVLIKLTSRGPVFFVHRREGRGGREFGCIKFRTMTTGAHRQQRELYVRNEVDGPQFKLANDPRVTRLGRWLRRKNIDELPQLINVLLGQMSLVGPRPSPFRENQICVPWRRARLSVRPGITGLWQLCRTRAGEGDFHQWIYYDLAYVRHFSLRLDLRILLHTILSKGGRRRVPLSRLIGQAAMDPAPDALGQPIQAGC